MPNHDRFECQTAIDSDAILQDNQAHYVDTIRYHIQTPHKFFKIVNPPSLGMILI